MNKNMNWIKKVNKNEIRIKKVKVNGFGLLS